MTIGGISFDHVLPSDIEKNSFAIIDKELKEKGILVPEELIPVVYRVIHTTADFDYVNTLAFSEDVLAKADEALRNGAHIVTDTTMAYSGINKRILAQFGGEAHCFIADPEVAKEAKERGMTRSAVSMEKAAAMNVPLIFAVGNAPTALISLYEEIQKGFRPELIIGVPVGFVNVVPSKELIMSTDVPYIINRGRKGGSNVAAAIVNALMYRNKR
ncbi:MAG: precorrin-8X methylmutase [Lachnospiraceae bacterium]|nr:precorrin-8X methylmutase [Candidatus Equihabitans merdae]